jgi:hypothetical protein
MSTHQKPEINAIPGFFASQEVESKALDYNSSEVFHLSTTHLRGEKGGSKKNVAT